MPVSSPAIVQSDAWVQLILSATKFVMNGSLILACGIVVVIALMPNAAGALTPSQLNLLNPLRRSCTALSLATAVFAMATTADVLAVSFVEVLRSPQFTTSLLFQTSLGRALLWQIGFALALSLVSFMVRRVTSTLAISLALLGIIIARAQSGHSGNSSWHMAAVESWALHIVGVCTWVGGVAVLAWQLRPMRRVTRTPAIGPDSEVRNPVAVDPSLMVSRFSPIAQFCSAIVIASGLINASIRVQSVHQLMATRYGVLLLIKIFITIAVIMLAIRARQRLLTNVVSMSLRRWLTTELVLLTTAVAVAVILSRTAPPVNPDANVAAFSPLREALGFTPPPEASLANLGWVQWRPDVLWLVIALLGAFAYLAGTRRLTQRGDAWSRARTFSWLAGLAVLTYATSGPLGVYGHIFFSAHMVQHLLLVMVCPILLMCGAPTTLALRALPANRENHGPREWLLALLQSKYLAVIANPLFAFINFIAGFFALYFSGLFEMLMQSHTGHLLMQLHFLTSGYLFFWAIIGIDPAPRKLPNPAKVGLVILAAPFHALFSVIIMQSTTVFAHNYFEQFRSAYSVNSLHDQYLGASFGWAFGEIPMVIVIAIAVRQWVRADARSAARFDRLDDERRAQESANPVSGDE